MRPGQGSAAKIGVSLERAAFDDLANGAEPPILELANIKLAVGSLVFRPAKKKVAGGL